MNCRSCGSSGLEEFLSLGKTPLANALLSAEQLLLPEPRYELGVAYCTSCALVQLTETVSPEHLFSDYVYFSSFSASMVEHAHQLTQRIVQDRELGPESLALEIASNDGYLLQWYQQAGVRVLGVEPAKNIAKIAREKKIETLEEFFNADLAERLKREGVQADVIHAHNVMAHVPGINGFVSGIRQVLKPKGIAVIEVPYVVDMIEKCEFDTIYHEHVFYFSVMALDKLFKRHDLLIQDVEHLNIHGGSLRLWVVPMSGDIMQNHSVKTQLQLERDKGVGQINYYRKFERNIAELRVRLVDKLTRLKQEGKHIAAYGASAKGSTLLNCFGIGKDLIDFVVDRSVYKQGKYMPGVHIEILPPSALLEYQPDDVLLLTWNFRDEIIAQQSEYLDRGGRFIVPLPKPYEISRNEYPGPKAHSA